MSVLAAVLFLGLGWDPITIDWDPTITEAGPFELTWHGVFTAVGIAAGVYLGAWVGRREGFTEDDAYSIALIGVPMGIIGARGMWVVENWETIDPWTDIFRINEGGITVFGAVAFGVIGAVIYGAFRRLPVLRGLDAAGFGLLLGMAIGRIGDFINGEHWGTESGLPWAVVYTHPASPGFSDNPGNRVAVHPATTYEMFGDLLIIGIMVLIFMRFWRTRPGVTFFTGLVLYSAMRFGTSYLRIDSCSSFQPHGLYEALENCPEYVISDWMTFPQVVAMVSFAIGVVGLVWTLLRAPSPEPKEAVDTHPARSPTPSPRRA